MTTNSGTRLVGNALVTGGSRGIGSSIAEHLAQAGMNVWVTGRDEATLADQAARVGARALVGDVSHAGTAERWASQMGDVDLLVANAGIAEWNHEAWTMSPSEWWRVFEVNVLGVYLSCRAVIPGMLARKRGRIIITGSGAAYQPGVRNSSYASSKAAVGRFGEVLAEQLLPHRIPVFVVTPGLVRTEMSDGRFPDNAPWTPVDRSAQLVVALASGRFDLLSGRFFHAEHDAPEHLEPRVAAIVSNDLNAVRLRR